MAIKPPISFPLTLSNNKNINYQKPVIPKSSKPILDKNIEYFKSNIVPNGIMISIGVPIMLTALELVKLAPKSGILAKVATGVVSAGLYILTSLFGATLIQTVKAASEKLKNKQNS